MQTTNAQIDYDQRLCYSPPVDSRPITLLSLLSRQRAPSEDCDHTVEISKTISVFAGRICNVVGRFAVLRLLSELTYSVMGQNGANTRGYLSRGKSTEYHICYYISKWSSWPIVFKSSICHLGKPGITPVFKMASKTATSYRNDPGNNNACLNQILSIKFCF